jgi:hypothetical protein
MTNPYRKEVIFSVDGKDHTIRPTFDLIAKLENDHGAFPAIARRVSKADLGFVDLAVMFHTMLGGAVSRESVQNAVVEQGYTDVLKTLEAFLMGVLVSKTAEPAEGNGEAAAT